MSGHIELERAISSIIIGHRHRTDLGDLDALAASIERFGLLQPPTVTPDGVLVCGRRRLAAVEKLGWRTTPVWVRSGVSDRLGHLLAEQDDNVLHKPLTPLEAAALYRELKELLAEDAARRQEASRFSRDRQPGDPVDGGGNLPPPSTPSGKTRDQAAAMIPGAAGRRTLDKIEYIQQSATRTDLGETATRQIEVILAEIDAGQPVDPRYVQVRALVEGARERRDADLDAMAREALARAQAAPRKRKQEPAPVAPMVWTTRSFLVIWGELDGWWTHYDPAELAGELTDEQIEMFLTIADATAEFAAALRTAHTTTEVDATERHLRAL